MLLGQGIPILVAGDFNRIGSYQEKREVGLLWMKWTPGSFEGLLRVMGWWILILLGLDLLGITIAKVGRKYERGWMGPSLKLIGSRYIRDIRFFICRELPLIIGRC